MAARKYGKIEYVLNNDKGAIMPVQMQKSLLMAKLAAKGKMSHDKHKNDELKLGFQELPGDIKDGIAQLTKITFGEYGKDAEGKAKEGAQISPELKGQLYFMAQGTVVEPVRYAGLMTRVGPEPLCDTPSRGGANSRKSFDDHYAWMLNQLHGLLKNPVTGEAQRIVSMEDVENTAALLAEKVKPYFRFSTSQGSAQKVQQDTDGKFYLYYVNRDGTLAKAKGKGPWTNEEAAKKANPGVGREPGVFHNWHGACIYESTHNPAAGFTETPAATAASNGHVATTASAASTPKPATNPAVARGKAPPPKPAPAPAPEPEPEQPVEEFSEFSEMEQLGAKADDGDGDAMQEIERRAEAAGVLETVQGAKSWAESAKIVQDAEAGATSEDGGDKAEGGDNGEVEDETGAAATDEAPFLPAKEEVYRYSKLRDPKNPKKTKTVDVEVLSVNETTKTVTLKNLETGKPIPDPTNLKKPLAISFEDLESAE